MPKIQNSPIQKVHFLRKICKYSYSLKKKKVKVQVPSPRNKKSIKVGL